MVHTINTAVDIGKTQYQLLTEGRFIDSVTAFNDTIHNNILPLLNFNPGRTPAESTSMLSNLLNDVQLF